jgi:hypothetical protein
MASVSNPNAAVVAGNGLGPKTFVFAITTGTITVSAAIDLATADYGLTVVGVSGTSGTAYLAAQGANIHHTDADGLESVSGVALTATFDQNPA